MVKIIFIGHVAAPLLKFFKEWLCLKCRVGDILPGDVLLRDILPRDILPRDLILVIYILHTTVKYHSSHIIESNSTQKCICIWLAVVLQECRVVEILVVVFAALVLYVSPLCILRIVLSVRFCFFFKAGSSFHKEGCWDQRVDGVMKGLQWSCGREHSTYVG